MPRPVLDTIRIWATHASPLRSPPFERRLPLPDERRHPFLLVIGGKEDAEEGGLVAETVFLGHVETVGDGVLGIGNPERTHAGYGPSRFPRLVNQLLRGKDFVDDPPGECL